LENHGCYFIYSASLPPEPSLFFGSFINNFYNKFLQQLDIYIGYFQF